MEGRKIKRRRENWMKLIKVLFGKHTRLHKNEASHFLNYKVLSCQILYIGKKRKLEKE